MNQNLIEFIDGVKKKSNGYWIKIKEALGKVQSRIVSNEKNVTDLRIKIENYQQARSREWQIVE